jgi:hypothetical protein
VLDVAEVAVFALFENPVALTRVCARWIAPLNDLEGYPLTAGDTELKREVQVLVLASEREMLAKAFLGIDALPDVQRSASRTATRDRVDYVDSDAPFVRRMDRCHGLRPPGGSLEIDEDGERAGEVDDGASTSRVGS